MKFTIKRSKWLRGDGAKSVLLNQDGHQCCIGQVCSQLGIPDGAMRCKATVDVLTDNLVVAERYALVSAGLLAGAADSYGMGWVSAAYETNDSSDIPDSLREHHLKKIAADQGHEFEFID